MWNKQTAAFTSSTLHWNIFGPSLRKKTQRYILQENARFHCNWCFHSGISHVLFVSYIHLLKKKNLNDLDWLDSQRIYFFWHHWGKFWIIFLWDNIDIGDGDWQKIVVNIIVSVNKTSKVRNVNRGCPWLFLPSQIFSTGRSWSNPF